MLDAYDLARLNGFKGSPDDYRKSVYLVNGFEALKKTGFGGNESDARRMFADGGASLSAYDVAVRHGYDGSPLDWLKTLRGSNGMDAYELAVSKGFAGTQSDWLKALAGQNGLSAYELAVAGGYQGTVYEWLESLVGEKGDKGDKGQRGDIGPMPEHQWDGSAIRFQTAPGVWGQWVDVAEFVEPGRVPKHEVDGQRVRFELPDGEWGQWINLSGPIASQIGAGSLRLHKFYAEQAQFPAVGQPGLLYITTDTTPHGVFVWNDGAYQQLSGPASSNSSTLISTDANNALKQGTDLKLYVDPPKAMIDDDQVLTGDPAGTVSITLTPTTVVDPENPDQTQVNYSIRGDVNVSQIISADAGNRATTGTDGKIFSPPAAAPVHAHAISDVTGLQTALDGKSAVGHGHAISDVTGLQTSLDTKATTTALTDGLATKAPLAHTHAIADVTGLQAALDTKATTTALTDGLATKAPLVHTHFIADTTGLQTELDSKATTAALSAAISTVTSDTANALAGKAPLVHTHAISDVTGLQTALDGKADAAHTHSAALYLSTDVGNVAVLGTDSKIYVPEPGNPIPPLGIIDNTIADPALIDTPGTYIVPATGLTGVFVGQANKYAVYDGEAFTFEAPVTGDKRAIQTGPNAGAVFTWNGTAWASAPTSSNSVYGSWLGGGAITIGAVTTAPTKQTIRQADRARCRKIAAAADGSSVYEVDYVYSALAATGATAGSGHYLLTLPAGLTFTAAKYPFYTGTGVIYNSNVLLFGIISNGTIANGINYSGQPIYVVPYDSTRFRVLHGQGANINSNYWGSANFQLGSAANFTIKFNFTLEAA